MQKEPALIIGAIATVLLNAIAEFAGVGLISEAAASSSTGLINGIVPLVIAILPLILGAITRQFVTSPSTAAALKAEVPEGYVKA